MRRFSRIICFQIPSPTPKPCSGVSDSVSFMRRFRSFKTASLLKPGSLLKPASLLNTKKEALRYRSASSLNQRLPILPGGLPPSTFGVCGLNCCVRHGNRWIPAAIATEFMFQDSYPDNCIKMFVLTSYSSEYGNLVAFGIRLKNCLIYKTASAASPSASI